MCAAGEVTVAYRAAPDWELRGKMAAARLRAGWAIRCMFMIVACIMYSYAWPLNRYPVKHILCIIYQQIDIQVAGNNNSMNSQTLEIQHL